MSGLTANSRTAALISSNIANATTESYGRRVLSVSSRGYGSSGGVWIDGVERQIDRAVLSDRRLSDAQNGFSTDMQAFASRIEGMVGESGEAGSLTARYSAFENALISAGSDPSSRQRLLSVSQTAQDLARTLNGLSDGIQEARLAADRDIAFQVTALNDGLRRVDELNEAIAGARMRSGDPSSLLDERQRVLDTISAIVPLRTADRENGGLAVYAASGAVLLDSSISSDPVQIGFTPTEPVTAGMTLANDLLSGLEIDGVAVNSTNDGPLGGGTLGAQFQIRDVVATDMQAALDGTARDLIERFAPGGPDTTLGATDPGLFTDSGAAFDALDETGIAGRISLNGLVAPDSATLWKLRDGLGAASEGEVGDASLIQAYSDSLEALVVPGSASLEASARSFGQHVADFHAAIAYTRVRADSELSFSSAQHTALKELELSSGVDTDAELQNLMLVEQQYAANARVMTVVDELMQTLMSI